MTQVKVLLINYFEWKGLQNDVILVEFTENGLLFLEDSAALSLGAQPRWEAMWVRGRVSHTWMGAPPCQRPGVEI